MLSLNSILKLTVSNHLRTLRSVIHAVFVLMICSIPASSSTYEQTLRFCQVSQTLAPIFLRGGDIPGESVCRAGAGSQSYACTTGMSLGEGVCRAGAGSQSYACTSGMSLGAGVCRAGAGSQSYACKDDMGYGEGVCRAGAGSQSYACTSGMSLGEGVCRAGAGSGSYACAGIGDEELGKGICMALGGLSSECSNITVHEAICNFTKNCKGFDAASLAISMAETCGAAVLYFGITK